MGAGGGGGGGGGVRASRDVQVSQLDEPSVDKASWWMTSVFALSAEAEVEGSAIVAMTPGIKGAAAALSFEAGLGNNEAFSAGLESMDGGRLNCVGFLTSQLMLVVLFKSKLFC